MSTIAVQSTYVSRRRSTVRLTRRGRLALFGLALLAVLALGLVVAGQSGASGEKGAAVPTRSVVVGSGDTLWDLARETADDESVRSMQDRIMELNGLDSPMLYAGQTLRVPLD